VEILHKFFRYAIRSKLVLVCNAETRWYAIAAKYQHCTSQNLEHTLRPFNLPSSKASCSKGKQHVSFSINVVQVLRYLIKLLAFVS